MNKLAADIPSANVRVRTHAAPINARRVSGFMEMRTPCLHAGSCHDCKSPGSICSQLLITRLCYPAQRICVLLVNEKPGF